MIEEVKKERPLPKKPNILVRIIIFVITAALVLGAVFLVINRDRLNFDALKRWFTYRTLTQSDTTGGGEPFAYQGGSQLSFLNLGGDLLAVSESGVRLYSPGGVAYVEDTVTLKHPTAQVSGKSAVVYDAGGSFLRVYRDRGEVFDLDDSAATVLSARLNAGGYLTVITRSSGYKGVVTVYDNSFRPRLALNLSSAFPLDGLVSPDNRSVLVVTADQQDQFFTSALALYSLTEVDEENPVPVAALPIDNRLPLDLVWDSGGLRVLAEHGALATDGALTETGTFDWSDRYLKRATLQSDDSFVILTGKYRSGSQTRLEIVDRAGEVIASREESRPILSLSAAGKYIGVLTAAELTIYTRDLTEYASTRNTQGASRLALLPNGSAYLAGGDTAWLYLPD